MCTQQMERKMIKNQITRSPNWALFSSAQLICKNNVNAIILFSFHRSRMCSCWLDIRIYKEFISVHEKNKTRVGSIIISLERSKILSLTQWIYYNDIGKGKKSQRAHRSNSCRMCFYDGKDCLRYATYKKFIYWDCARPLFFNRTRDSFLHKIFVRLPQLYIICLTINIILCGSFALHSMNCVCARGYYLNDAIQSTSPGSVRPI